MRTGDQIVQDLPWRWSVQGKIFLIGGLGYMFDAWDVALNGFLTPLVGTEFGLSAGGKGLVATANLIGMAVGAVAWGTVADRIGRKKAFSITLLLFALFSVLGALAPNVETFLALRFLAGIGLGGCIPVDYAIVSEFSPRKHRGRVLSAMDGWWPIGTTLAAVSATLLLPVEGNWRWMLVLMILPALLLFWVRRGVPESPLYLVRKGREAEARAVIDDLVRRTGATPEPYSIPPAVVEDTRGGAVAAAFDQLRRVWAFNPRITAVAWSLFISVMLVYYAALSWMPSILRAQGFGEIAAFASTALMNATGIVGVAVAVLLVDKVGRKRIIMVAGPLTALSLVVFSLLLDTPAAAVVAIGAFGLFALVVIPVMYAYVSELYPTELRASGFGWASSSSRAITGFAPLLFGSVLWPVLGLPLTFTVLGLLVVAAVVFMKVGAPETRGRELDRIVEPVEPPAETRTAL
ncbi:MFS transporter [Amycolatopsis keratiniphila]|uniref:MFS transporter n=1 Tax=Amycolatopsis keratiniphila subsp. keratiniphila TaxID=227715 RepID=A0A1W2LKI3_9PSEU|nr:MFS transporter [Amycolatopsis keratiniphila]OLZ52780.1 MFS transporter [Amycolatopsis keratiniphila subsp. nogabecina]ONF63389.1 MFS transporter [Amycolatopsis keratiniphila subsp. keratiniphila]SDU08807.1 MFS transporter, putative metabolite:H+ symporter [Amycolatopsis keratiniphila]